MEGGWTEDAMVDFTGGIGQRIDLTRKKEIPPNFFDRLLVQHQMSTLMGCSINVSMQSNGRCLVFSCYK
jgi:Calpain family cysteine protease